MADHGYDFELKYRSGAKPRQESDDQESKKEDTESEPGENLSETAVIQVEAEGQQGEETSERKDSQQEERSRPAEGLRLYSEPDRSQPAEEPSLARRGMENKGYLYCVLVLFGIGALLLLILVPLGFSDLDYYQIGLKKSKTTGRVDSTKVYLGGRHFVGVDKTFKPFRADAHIERFYRITVFNKEKLQVTMTCDMEYFLYPKELGMLHDAYDVKYSPVLRNTALAAIKAAAAKFKVDQYRLERHVVAEALAKAAKVSLGGTCCRSNCTNSNATCTVAERGLFAELRYFQLEIVDITAEQEYRYLRQALENERLDTENFKQKEQVTRKETERLKKIVQNEALEIAQNATAKANLIAAKAAAEAKAIVENARNSGLQIIYNTLNITNQEHKKSFDYLRTLRDLSKANMYIGFQTIVAKP